MKAKSWQKHTETPSLYTAQNSTSGYCKHTSVNFAGDKIYPKTHLQDKLFIERMEDTIFKTSN